jgi:hypothetical protein
LLGSHFLVIVTFYPSEFPALYQNATYIQQLFENQIQNTTSPLSQFFSSGSFSVVQITVNIVGKY